MGSQAQSRWIQKPKRIIAVKGNAQAAGLRPGDLLLEVESQPVESFFPVITIMNTKKPGDLVAVKIQRDDQVLLRTVVAVGR
jgi:putative serine protease PepD